jgi:hypothetical protein
MKILIPKAMVNRRQQRKSPTTMNFNRTNNLIALYPQEPLIDPRLIYRLQAITTDLTWPSPCTQCSILPHLPSVFTTSTQTISFDLTTSAHFLDPRRESLKNLVLKYLYHRMKTSIPHLFISNCNRTQTLLFEQTRFKTNCSLHLEYLLHKIKIMNDEQFLHLIKVNDEFQLSTCLLNKIFTSDNSSNETLHRNF